jgi:hypothetical protein
LLVPRKLLILSSKTSIYPRSVLSLLDAHPRCCAPRTRLLHPNLLQCGNAPHPQLRAPLTSSACHLSFAVFRRPDHHPPKPAPTRPRTHPSAAHCRAARVSRRFDEVRGTVHVDLGGKEYVFRCETRDDTSAWFVALAHGCGLA